MKIRITCKAPPSPQTGGDSKYPLLNGLVASWPDVRVVAIGDDGTEVDLKNVVDVRFRWEPGPEPARVSLVLIDPEVEIVTELGSVAEASAP